MSLDKLKQTIIELINSKIPIQTVWVEVLEVDWEARTMTAVGIDDEVEYYDVLLGLGSIDLKPVIGSDCLIGIIENRDTSSFLIMINDVEEINLNTKTGISIKLSKDEITVEALNKPIRIYSGNSSVELTSNGVDITSDRGINLNGGFEALYNKIPGMPITDVSQIGVSKKVKIG